jgi:hypothetical protein
MLSLIINFSGALKEKKEKKTFSAALSNMHAVFSITFYKN